MAGGVPRLSGRLERRHPAAARAAGWLTQGSVRRILKYLLDTDSVSYALRGQGEVGTRIRNERPSDLCMSAISLAELRYGAERKGSRKLHGLIDTFASAVEVVSFDEAAAVEFGRLASILADRGTPIGEFDVLIAA